MKFKASLHPIVPLKSLNNNEWPREIIDDGYFAVVHEVTVRKCFLDPPYDISA